MSIVWCLFEYEAVVMGQFFDIRFVAVPASSNRACIIFELSSESGWVNAKLYLALVSRSDIFQAMISKDCSCGNPCYFFGIILLSSLDVATDLLCSLTNFDY